MKKRPFFLNHKRSSAVVATIAIHAVFIAVALTFVAVKVYVKPEQGFEAKPVQRPQMKLRKLQIPVKQQKKTQAPKLRKTIVTKAQNKIDIKMPEIVGIKGGSGYGNGGGLGGLGFGFEMDLFGSSRGTGNEFIGNFYDLKKTRNGELSDIGANRQLAWEETAEQRAKDKHEVAFWRHPKFEQARSEYKEAIRNFAGSWNERRFEDYFKAPKQKYTTCFMMPEMEADQAPKAFGVADQVEPSFWVCHYKGTIAAPETGRYRFCGIGDDIMLVRIGKRLVLDASIGSSVTGWKSDADSNRKFKLEHIDKDTGGGGMVVGDWFDLKKASRSTRRC